VMVAVVPPVTPLTSPAAETVASALEEPHVA